MKDIVEAKSLLLDGVTMAGARSGKNGDLNKLSEEDQPAHRWYRFVLSYPPHLVRHYLKDFGLRGSHRVLDPFCGTGTTVVESKKLGIPSEGIEANPMAFFATSVKVDWDVDPQGLLEHAEKIAALTQAQLESEGLSDDDSFFLPPDRDHGPELRTLPEAADDLLLTDSLSPLPMHKTLTLLDILHQNQDGRFLSHERLALAKALVFSISNLHFGPEVGIGPKKEDAAVVGPWLSGVREMVNDLKKLRRHPAASVQLHLADARELPKVIKPNSIDAVIPSPPYPNEKDYTRTTRLESVMLGFLSDRSDVRALKRRLVRSNTRRVYKGDDDDHGVRDHPEIQRIATAIEARRIELGKTSGFERMYARVTRLYFGGMLRHLADLRKVLRPGARLAYVVGDQASYLRVMIRTGEILADLAKSLGYEVIRIDLFRTRLSTATKEQLREEVVVLRWPGKLK